MIGNSTITMPMNNRLAHHLDHRQAVECIYAEEQVSYGSAIIRCIDSAPELKAAIRHLALSAKQPSAGLRHGLRPG